MLRRLRIENLVLIRSADLELGPGLNALTGETGAGKTIFAQAIGLLLGERGDASLVGPAGNEAYVEAELEVPDDFFGDGELEAVAGLRPEDEAGLVLARRVFADGRTRAYAWGRTVTREDLARAMERLIAMSGQFEQRRLARPAFQLDVLDAYAGDEQTVRRREAQDAWRALTVARHRLDDIARDAFAAAARVEAMRDLVERTEDLEAGEDEALRAEREWMRNAHAIAEATTSAIAALAPEEGEGAVSLVASAERLVASVTPHASELEPLNAELGELRVRLSEAGSGLHHFLASLEVDPGRMEEVEARLDLLAGLRRRFGVQSLGELLERREAARRGLAELDGGDPVAAAEAEVERSQQRYDATAAGLRAARSGVVEPFAQAVRDCLAGVGMGEGDFEVELREREAGPAGRDEAVFLIRPNRGLPFGPVAETASGGELSRVALALAVVAGGETLVFDEIDAGIGGVTGHHVAETLARVAARAQVVTITHLPQIASVADRHFRVEKIPGDPTHTRIEQLEPEERRAEIERMLGGEEFLTAVTGEPRR